MKNVIKDRQRQIASSSWGGALEELERPEYAVIVGSIGSTLVPEKQGPTVAPSEARRLEGEAREASQ